MGLAPISSYPQPLKMIVYLLIVALLLLYPLVVLGRWVGTLFVDFARFVRRIVRSEKE